MRHISTAHLGLAAAALLLLLAHGTSTSVQARALTVSAARILDSNSFLDTTGFTIAASPLEDSGVCAVPVLTARTALRQLHAGQLCPTLCSLHPRSIRLWFSARRGRPTVLQPLVARGLLESVEPPTASRYCGDMVSF